MDKKESKQPARSANALHIIQQELNAPKGQFNKFGNYNYRNCEDILEAVKPLLEKTESVLIVTDRPIVVGEWLFIEATARLIDGDGKEWTASASAKHADSQPGMSAGQLTGSTSSYARKYALNGLFAIDDAKDDDTRDNSSSTKNVSQIASQPANEPSKPTFQERAEQLKSEPKGEPKKSGWTATPTGEKCPACGVGERMHLINTETGKSFFGCSLKNETGCTGRA